MKKMFVLLCALAICSTSWAGIMIHPKSLTFDDKTKSAEIMLANSNQDESANYRVTLTYKKQNADGSYTDFKEGDTLPDNSAINMLRYSPRSVMLSPSKSQMVRVLKRLPEGLPAGEYVAYITFTEVVLEKPRTAEKPDNSSFSVKLTPIPSFSIPIFVRHGVKNISKANIRASKLRKIDGKLYLPITLTRIPDQMPTSIRGDVSVWLGSQMLGMLKGKYILAGNNLISALVPLQNEKENLTERMLNGKTLKVLFTRPAEKSIDRKNIVSQTEIKL